MKFELDDVITTADKADDHVGRVVEISVAVLFDPDLSIQLAMLLPELKVNAPGSDASNHVTQDSTSIGCNRRIVVGLYLN